MNLPFTLPDWLPTWAFLILALLALLYLFAFLLMPFSVFGVKSRLEAMESQLEAVQEELRVLSNRSPGMAASGLAAVARRDDEYDVPNFGQLKAGQTTSYVAPAPSMAPPVSDRVRPAAPPERPAPRPRRMEPRLD